MHHAPTLRSHPAHGPSPPVIRIPYQTNVSDHVLVNTPIRYCVHSPSTTALLTRHTAGQQPTQSKQACFSRLVRSQNANSPNFLTPKQETDPDIIRSKKKQAAHTATSRTLGSIQ
ncbi:hypothetical protein NW756_005145 [Fusarium oxysporum]|nr:hypothetical protein NW758_005601 [Fusarium oxysporum]KAJ4047989.1 hypothetical protein NW753_008933 [Fusarium oxysporum]KAJ4093242.1 hypothetical protein NW756_005145 [Fusarium oxysporum]KAJ4105773.1 hypothetical protein NW769_009173 [Fusarium oxysporum]